MWNKFKIHREHVLIALRNKVQMKKNKEKLRSTHHDDNPLFLTVFPFPVLLYSISALSHVTHGTHTRVINTTHMNIPDRTGRRDPVYVCVCARTNDNENDKKTKAENGAHYGARRFPAVPASVKLRMSNRNF